MILLRWRKVKFAKPNGIETLILWSAVNISSEST